MRSYPGWFYIGAFLTAVIGGIIGPWNWKLALLLVLGGSCVLYLLATRN